MSMMLDYLRTPMAAPETTGLRTMRELILVSCLLVAMLVLLVQFVGFDGIRSWLVARGLSAQTSTDVVAALRGGIAALILTIAVLAPVYVVRKNRADDAHLFALVSRGDEA